MKTIFTLKDIGNHEGSHPGDWEYIEIFFLNDLPYKYHFSNHKGIRIKSPDEVIVSNSKLQVWCANRMVIDLKAEGNKNILAYGRYRNVRPIGNKRQSL